jgi:hypothetical protein
LSERLDQAMAAHLPPATISAADYLRAWQAVGEEPARRRQIALTLGVGQALDGYTRSRLVHATLKLMRRPAEAAGFGALQHFLEVGFDAFASMRGSKQFLQIVGQRESRLMDALFDPAARVGTAADPQEPAGRGGLHDLPGLIGPDGGWADRRRTA